MQRSLLPLPNAVIVFIHAGPSEEVPVGFSMRTLTAPAGVVELHRYHGPGG